MTRSQKALTKATFSCYEWWRNFCHVWSCYIHVYFLSGIVNPETMKVFSAREYSVPVNAPGSDGGPPWVNNSFDCLPMACITRELDWLHAATAVWHASNQSPRFLSETRGSEWKFNTYSCLIKFFNTCIYTSRLCLAHPGGWEDNYTPGFYKNFIINHFVLKKSFHRKYKWYILFISIKYTNKSYTCKG